MKWYENNATVIAFAYALVSGGEWKEPADVVYFFEKPWKWSDEYEIWDRRGRPYPLKDSDELRPES